MGSIGAKMKCTVCKWPLCLIIAYLFAGETMTSCLLQNKKIRNERTEPSVFDTSSFVITRSSDKTAAQVKFSTQIPLLCSIEVYAQDPNNTPKEESPLVYPCASKTPAQNFDEKVPGLTAENLYYFHIFAWETEQSKDSAASVVIKETPSGDQNSTDKGKYQEIFVSRIDVPLKTDEIHRHIFKDKISPAEISAKLSRPIGCKAGEVPSLGDWSDADPDFKLANVATRGFANGFATPHLSDKSRNKIVFSNYQFADHWEWVFDLNGKTQSFTANAATQLLNVSMTSAVKTDFKTTKTGEVEPVTTPNIDPTKPLKIQWHAEQPNDTSFFILQIGRKPMAGSFHCVFNLKDEQSTVDKTWLEALPKGTYPVIATAESHQIEAAENTGAWLLTAYDWKAAGALR